MSIYLYNLSDKTSAYSRGDVVYRLAEQASDVRWRYFCIFLYIETRWPPTIFIRLKNVHVRWSFILFGIHEAFAIVRVVKRSKLKYILNSRLCVCNCSCILAACTKNVHTTILFYSGNFNYFFRIMNFHILV